MTCSDDLNMTCNDLPYGLLQPIGGGSLSIVDRGHARRQIALPPVAKFGVAMSPNYETHQQPLAEDVVHPLCARCCAPMSLTSVENEYPGYERRIFECQACGAKMTEWTGLSRSTKGPG